MSRLERAREFRNKIDANLTATRKLIRVDDLSEEELIEMIDLYSTWESALLKSEKVIKGSYYQYNNILYIVEQDHIPQENWNPERANTHWRKALPDSVIEAWEQRYGHNPYEIGIKVIWQDKVYECIVSTTYSPQDMPTHWKLV